VRRLDGFDALYRDLRDPREELVEFAQALRDARAQVTSGLMDRDKCTEQCREYRSGFEERITALEAFRWKLAGVVGVFVAIPAIGSFIMLLVTRLS